MIWCFERFWMAKVQKDPELRDLNGIADEFSFWKRMERDPLVLVFGIFQLLIEF